MGRIASAASRLVGSAMNRMAKAFDKIPHVAPDLEVEGRPMNRVDRRAARSGNRYRATSSMHSHKRNPAGTKIENLFLKGTATQRHPG